MFEHPCSAPGHLTLHRRHKLTDRCPVAAMDADPQPARADFELRESDTCVSKSSSMDSGQDSGYGSSHGLDCGVTTTGEMGTEQAQATTTGPQQPPATPGLPGPVQRRFKGLPIFDPSLDQFQRYDEILRYITPALDGGLRKRARLGIRSKARRIDLVRLIVAGETQETARPYVVFFCNSDVGNIIKTLLDQSKFQELLQVDGRQDLSFQYQIIHDGVRLTFEGSHYSVEFPKHDPACLTYCGLPIRLRCGDSETARKATLGGILQITLGRGAPTFYAMTAGHFLDDWEGNDENQPLESLPNDYETESHLDPSLVDDHSQVTTTFLEDISETLSSWGFSLSKRYKGLITAYLSQESRSEAHFQYYDWALVALDGWKPNIVLEEGASEPGYIQGCSKYLLNQETGKRVKITIDPHRGRNLLAGHC
ncbi:hypothetical protein B0T16DRAFT_101369 [Cercophora newfieldiana]|uniref:Uncharacterized protein n=1 Tax=Cercophora newfieldiana TaxID=92897 RepID=A0AA39YI68_9PEZI|nr:hypothetical protein B0T16DRAFT_101369 [Cercophora newfieldiana]